MNSVGAKGGICFWTTGVKVDLHSMSQHHIDASVKGNERLWRFTVLHGHPESHLRHLTWSLIKRVHNLDNSA